MKKISLLILMFIPVLALAQLPEWIDPNYRGLVYSVDEYFTGYAVQSIQSGDELSTVFNQVKDAAKVEAIQSIQVRVENITKDIRLSASTETTKDFDEKIIEFFSSDTKLSTDLELTGLHVEACRQNNEVIGFAYIKRSDVIHQFDKSISNKLSKIEIYLDNINELTAKGQKVEARNKIEPLSSLFTEIEAEQKVLLSIDKEADLERIQMHRFNALWQRYIQLSTQLKNGLNIYIDCTANLLGIDHPALGNAIKGNLSQLGCSFFDTADGADYTIIIDASARKHNAQAWGNATTYFAYVDATIRIQNVITNQLIYVGNESVKGSHTISYSDAACTAYENLTDALIKIISEHLQ